MRFIMAINLNFFIILVKISYNFNKPLMQFSCNKDLKLFNFNCNILVQNKKNILIKLLKIKYNAKKSRKNHF